MNITNLNTHALINTAKSLIEVLRNNKKATISNSCNRMKHLRRAIRLHNYF